MVEPKTREYSSSLAGYLDSKKLPKEWFEHPDYVALVPPSRSSFQGYAREFSRMAERTAFMETERFQVVVLLIGALSVGKFGHVKWVDIREPFVEMVGETQPQVEHMGFYYPNFEVATSILRVRNVNYQIGSGADHDYIDVIYDRRGSQFRLNNKCLEEVLECEINRGDARLL